MLFHTLGGAGAKHVMKSALPIKDMNSTPPCHIAELIPTYALGLTPVLGNGPLGPPDAIGFDHCTRQRECAVCGADDDGVLLDLLVGDVCRAGQPHSG